MRKTLKLPVLLLIALTAFISVGVLVLSGGNTSGVYAESEYTGTYLSGYNVTYDIQSNRSMLVTEDIRVSFHNRSGVIKYIPVNAGEQVKNVNVYELNGNTLSDVYYSVSLDSDAVYLDIGDYSEKNEEHTYRISYEYCLTKAQEGKNVLALTPIGADWPCKIENVNIKIILPDGYIKNSALCFVNYSGTKKDIKYIETISNGGKTILSASIDYLNSESEVRFDMTFNDGSLTVYSDNSPYFYAIPAVLIFAVLILLKLFVFNKDYLTPVVNYTAPDKMDPLIMGKLIDNKVNNEDITSLIYYWASKGYLKINLDDKNDPSLIRIIQTLPESCPDYERYMFYRLFKYGEVVKPSQLRNSFYKVTEKVTAMVNKQSKGLYETKSFIVSCLFTALGGLLLWLAPLIIAYSTISAKLLYFPALIAAFPVILIYLSTIALKYVSLKSKKRNLVAGGFAIAFACAVFGFLYVLLLPSCIIGIGPKIAIFIACCPVFTCSVLLISRTKSYTEALNGIIGFKNFITLAEKDQLEMMLEEDPQFYYKVLPYAQVLGVSNIWEDKFASLTVQPPQWITGNFLTTYVEFRIISSMIDRSMRNISSEMISRPSSSSSGLSGGSHGGHFGGFSGGGHGGGGGRFR